MCQKIGDTGSKNRSRKIFPHTFFCRVAAGEPTHSLLRSAARCAAKPSTFLCFLVPVTFTLNHQHNRSRTATHYASRSPSVTSRTPYTPIHGAAQIRRVRYPASLPNSRTFASCRYVRASRLRADAVCRVGRRLLTGVELVQRTRQRGTSASRLGWSCSERAPVSTRPRC